MLRNPTLYGISHDDLEKDNLLEQVSSAVCFHALFEVTYNVKINFYGLKENFEISKFTFPVV